MDISKIKQLFLRIMIGCLVAAAGVAVVAVLVGSFNEIVARALFTVLLVAMHALISLGFIKNNEKQDTFESLAFFTNATFTLIIMSFLTSVLGVWGLINGELVWRLYGLYGILLFAVLHGEVLYKMRNVRPLIDTLIKVNYVFMGIVVTMLIPAVFTNALSDLPDYYYRILAAAGIVDATLTIVAVIMHNIYIQKHPKLANPVFLAPLQPSKAVTSSSATPGAATPTTPPKRHMNIFVTILVIYVGFQVICGVFVLLAWAISGAI